MSICEVGLEFGFMSEDINVGKAEDYPITTSALVDKIDLVSNLRKCTHWVNNLFHKATRL